MSEIKIYEEKMKKSVDSLKEDYTTSPPPHGKEKAGDCSPAFFDLIRPGGIVVIKAAGALCAGIVAYVFTALVNTTAACAGVGEYSEDVERFYLHLRSTITLFHVKFLL